MYIILVSYIAGTAEIPFNSIVFQELLHKGTFKTVHRALVNHPPGGMLGQEVALKRLKGRCVFEHLKNRFLYTDFPIHW